MKCAWSTVSGVGCELPNLSGFASPIWNASLVPINQTMVFNCDAGKRLDTDFEIGVISAKCLNGNQWDLPVPWPTCIESKHIK